VNCGIKNPTIRPLLRLLAALLLCTLFGGRAVCADEPADVLRFGMSTALSGPAQLLGQNMELGIRAAFERSNRAGGPAGPLHGKRLELLSLDDGYEPSRTGHNMRRLIEQERVLAIIGNVGTPTATVSIPIARQLHTLLFAPYSGGGILRPQPPERYVINFRASYAEETAAMIEALTIYGKLKPEEIAFFSQRDSYGDSVFSGAVKALKRHGLKSESSLIHTRYERNTLAVESAVADILSAARPPKAVIMVGTYAPCAAFITLAQASGLHPLFLNVSFVGSEPLAGEVGKNSHILVTQVVPPFDGTSALASEFREDIALVDSLAVPSFGAFEGYTAARILVKALEQLDEPPTRENIIDALEQLGNFDIGLPQPLHLGADEHQASHGVWPTILKHGSYQPFDWKDIPRLLRRGQYAD
jgi:ABC-type branched-subunit amino acid transport system substrate-binding protein